MSPNLVLTVILSIYHLVINSNNTVVFRLKLPEGAQSGEPLRRFKSGPFLYLKDEGGVKLPNVYLHCVNNIENYIKRYAHTGMEVISLISP